MTRRLFNQLQIKHYDAAVAQPGQSAALVRQRSRVQIPAAAYFTFYSFNRMILNATVKVKFATV